MMTGGLKSRVKYETDRQACMVGMYLSPLQLASQLFLNG